MTTRRQRHMDQLLDIFRQELVEGDWDRMVRVSQMVLRLTTRWVHGH